MTKILLVRHGHVEGIKPERFRGRSDLALTEQGLAQANAVAQHIGRLWRPVKAYTSPLKRCTATANAISRSCGCDVQILDSLSDIDYGTWQGKDYDEMKRADPQLFTAWFATPHLVRFPDGEALQDLIARTANALRFVLDHHASDTVVLVGHDKVNRALLLQLLDQPLSAYWRLGQQPCCINEIDVEDRTTRVRSINETGHLCDLQD